MRLRSVTIIIATFTIVFGSISAAPSSRGAGARDGVPRARRFARRELPAERRHAQRLRGADPPARTGEPAGSASGQARVSRRADEHDRPRQAPLPVRRGLAARAGGRGAGEPGRRVRHAPDRLERPDPVLRVPRGRVRPGVRRRAPPEDLGPPDVDRRSAPGRRRPRRADRGRDLLRPAARGVDVPRVRPRRRRGHRGRVGDLQRHARADVRRARRAGRRRRDGVLRRGLRHDRPRGSVRRRPDQRRANLPVDLRVLRSGSASTSIRTPSATRP